MVQGLPRYRPIGDCALIGDCHGWALVSRRGSIDSAALRRFDADPVFCRLLDADRGGFWSLCPGSEFSYDGVCLKGTNILRTPSSVASTARPPSPTSCRLAAGSTPASTATCT